MVFRTKTCVFQRYCSNQHGYRCLDSSGRVYVSRHVRFHESVFPFANKDGMFLTCSAPKNTDIFTIFLPFNSSNCFPSDDHVCLQEAGLAPKMPYGPSDSSLTSPQASHEADIPVSPELNSSQPFQHSPVLSNSGTSKLDDTLMPSSDGDIDSSIHHASSQVAYDVHYIIASDYYQLIPITTTTTIRVPSSDHTLSHTVQFSLFLPILFRVSMSLELHAPCWFLLPILSLPTPIIIVLMFTLWLLDLNNIQLELRLKP